MTDSKDKSAPAPSGPRRPGEAKQSGRVAFDARGNPIWEWQTSTGVFSRNVSTQRLKKLEAQDLKLADTQSLPQPKGLSLEKPVQMPGGGSNPYDNSAAPKRSPPAKAAAASKKSLAAKFKKPTQPQSAWEKLKTRLFDKK